jgi:hypothetical protein
MVTMFLGIGFGLLILSVNAQELDEKLVLYVYRG